LKKPLNMAGLFKILEKIGHRPQEGLNAKIIHHESISHVLKRSN